MKKGTVAQQEEGHTLIRIGGADQKVTRIFLAVMVPLLLLLAVWVYREVLSRPGGWRFFAGIYAGALLLYGNVGVWVHEQLHVLGFRGTVNEKHAEIFYARKFVLGLKGHYSVTGDIAYRVMRRALLMPLVLAISFVGIGLAGSFFLPGWWLPVALSLAVWSVFDMIHDLYMVSQIRKIGERGTYQDKGHYLEVRVRE